MAQINSMRIEQKLTKEFSKNQEFETYLSLLNNTLSEAESSLYRDLEEKYPAIHIVGAPRSGTTLLTQIVCSSLNVGYINNLIAAFWKAPLFGIQLSKKLLGTQYLSNFSSSFGRTNNIYEPHEFGYFWNYHLSYPDFQQRGAEHEQIIDWGRLKKTIINMAFAFDMPLLFKSVLMGFHAQHLFKILPKTCFIYVKRNRINNAFSILKFREKLLGDVKLWASIKPKQYDWLQYEDIYSQIAGQILFLEYEYLQQLKSIPDANKIIVSYEEVCENPKDFLTRVKQMVEQQNISCEIKNVLPSFTRKENANITHPEVSSLFQDAFTKIKSGHPCLNSL